MYQNAYVLENLSRQLVQDRVNEARAAEKVNLAKLVQRSLAASIRLVKQPVASKTPASSAA